MIATFLGFLTLWLLILGVVVSFIMTLELAIDRGQPLGGLACAIAGCVLMAVICTAAIGT